MEFEHFLSETGADYIQSRSNPRVVAFAKLSEKKYRDADGRFLAEGVKLAEEALRYAGVEVLVFAESAVRKQDTLFRLAKTANALGTPVSVFADSAFEKVSTESAPQGVIAVTRTQTALHVSDGFNAWQAGKRLLMLDEVRDPGNLGTILRSAEALGITGVILSGSADLYSPKTVRAAMGTLFRMPTYTTGDASECVRLMRLSGRRVLAAALGEHTMTLGAYPVEAGDCPVIGNEGHGVSKAVLEGCTACVRIPMTGSTESLNASAAAACILWEYHRALDTLE